MGRPPSKLDLLPVHMRLPRRTLERIDALMGEGKRSQFMREALENELKRREG